MIEPGDTIRVIGVFDNQGNCDVNHDSNLLITHPNLLLSGTRVSLTSTSSFVSYPLFSALQLIGVIGRLDYC